MLLQIQIWFLLILGDFSDQKIDSNQTIMSATIIAIVAEVGYVTFTAKLR